jgi:hypothetical protein
MLRASLLTALFSSSCLAFLGDWNVWTPSTDARQSVVLNHTAWVATSGGVMEWDLEGGSSRMHTRKTGLPTIDIASIVLDSNKSVWAIGADGRIGYRTLGATEWESVESYSSQNWTFVPRAAQFWKGPNHPGFLILGTKQGLSLFSLKSMAAEDYVPTFGNISGEVHAVMVTPGATNSGSKPAPDTLWVALNKGLVHATPNWDSVGTAGHFLADPSKWTVDSTVPAEEKKYRSLVRDANGVRLGYAPVEWSNSTGNLSILSGTLAHSGWPASIRLDGAVHSIPYGDKLLVSTLYQGAVLATRTGSVQTSVPEGNYPDIPPPSLRFKGDGSVVSLTGPYGSRLWTLSPITKTWLSDTIRYFNGSENVEAIWDINETSRYNRVGLAIDPQGTIIVPGWSQEPFAGGIFTNSPTGKLWNHFSYNAPDTCASFPLKETPKGELGPKYSSAILAARSYSTGTWVSAASHTYLGRVLFLEPGGQKPPTCLDIPVENSGGTQIVVKDLLLVGDTLWMASATSLIRLPSPRPSYPPPVVTNASFYRASISSDLNLNRLAKVDFEDKIWIVGAADGRLVLYPADGTWGGKTRSNLITSDATASMLNQKYTTLNVDAQGQIWAGGDKGIDIVQLAPPESDTAGPTFQLVRRITTNDGLPENQINDLDLQVSTGKAVIATPRSVAIWTSPYRPIAARLAKSGVRVRPNPVRLRSEKTLYVDGATADSRFDLLAADGTLVMHLDASKMEGGQFQIPLPAPSKLRPGLYFWSLKDSKGSVRGPLLIAE